MSVAARAPRTTIEGHIRVEHSTRRDRAAATLSAGAEEFELWFERGDGSPVSSDVADLFVLASLLWWMERVTSVHVHGTVTHRLLQNLADWQDAWVRFRPDRYSRVTITADEVVEGRAAEGPAALAYSGGLDAQYSLLRNVRADDVAAVHPIGTAVLVHGFDIPLGAPDVFARAAARARSVLDRYNVPLITLRTNFRALPQSWEDAHGLGVAAAMHTLSDRFPVGLIASGSTYEAFNIRWGSTPLTDHLLSSGLMEIRHDGAGATRTAKARLVAQDRDIVSALRVCWEGSELDRNCGRCEKCVRTYWNLHVAGVSDPACFESVVASAWRVRAKTKGVRGEWRSIRDEAESSGDVEARAFASQVIWRNQAAAALRWLRALLRRRARSLRAWVRPC